MNSGEGETVLVAEPIVCIVSDQVLDDLAQRISKLSAAITRAFIIEVGGLVTRELYGGNPSAWRLNGPKDKDCSLRRLASRPSMGVSPATLYRTLAAYELLSRAGSPWRWPGLTISHLRMVSGLPFGDQSALLDRAEREVWTVSRLDQEAARLRAKGPLALSPIGTQSPRIRRWRRGLLKIRTFVSQMNEDLEAAERAEIALALAELEAWCATVRERLIKPEADVSTWKQGRRRS